MNGRRRSDFVEKAREESAQPVRIWRMPVFMYVYANSAQEAKDAMQKVVEHWLVDRAMLPALDQIVEVAG